ncbi:hypothetical protein SCHPADRAFT_937718 [Schizopora paradoxa]|uniref:BTB domain-containing protein n=1 Tax=Schizopora paradoxa TaxID=27342 RepID=A0A0H2RX81_9AGAM|nr:hypothetical protein SCHPADRAFT_937718 [Schizopora paradoxa]
MNAIERLEEVTKIPEPHEILWFLDGNVVLATDVYLFKVHKGVLSLQSTVFRDMFDLSNAVISTDGGNEIESVQDTYEGVPLVTLVGDDGEDVAHLLRAVYEPRNRTPLDVVVALLLLSAKYDFKGVWANVVVQISRQYPTHLQDYDAVDNDDNPLFDVRRNGCPFTLLCAAFKANADVLLPILYFACSDFGMKSVIFETRENDTPSDCVNTLLEGREELDRALNKFIWGLPELLRAALRGGRNQCNANPPCVEAFPYSYLSDLISSDFNRTRGSFVADAYLGPGCPNCKLLVKNAVETAREEYWEKVPSHFGCPEWHVIERQLDELENS